MKEDIIHNATQNLLETAGIVAAWRKTGPLDGQLKMKLNGRQYTYNVKVKPEVRPHDPQITQLHSEYQNLLVIANRINPKAKAALREKGIAYLEANGNFHLKNENVYFLIDTKDALPARKTFGNRAFTKTGLKVLFHLLQNRDDINLPHRELAEKVGVGLGNIPQVLEGLRETGYLLLLNNKAYIWENRKQLLERWINEYETVLRPKLKKEYYTYKGKWQDIILNTETSAWGGEPAADILTNHLRPEKYILYTTENRSALMKNYKLQPAQDGEIEVLELFWKHTPGKNTPAPILIYTDLLLEGGKRNKETAEKIYHEYIEPNL